MENLNEQNKLTFSEENSPFRHKNSKGSYIFIKIVKEVSNMKFLNYLILLKLCTVYYEEMIYFNYILL